MADRPTWTGGADPPPPSGPPRRHLAFVALLALVALALIAGTVYAVRQSLTPAPTVAGPAPEPSASATAEPTETPTSKPRRERRQAQQRPLGRPTDLTDLAKQVAELRGLELRRRLRSRLVSEKDLADKISQLAFEEQDPQEVENNEDLLIALRLAPPDVGLADIIEDLYREQILGLYVPEEQTLYVRRRGGGSPAQRITTAHEIAHALQDQAFDLVDLQAEYEDDADASLAVLSLVEGDAVLTQQLWAQRYLTADELQDAAAESAGGEALERAPDYLRESLFFPYSSGSMFVADLYRNGGFDAIDDAFRNPPTTSEQIMYPDRYREGDEALAVRIVGRPGSGWEPATNYEFGAFDLDQMLRVLGAGTAADASEGWGGGVVRSWERADETAVAAALRFDTGADAAEVCEALPRWYVEVADGESAGPGTYRGDRDHFVFRCSGDEVRFALAPTAQTARKLTAAP